MLDAHEAQRREHPGQVLQAIVSKILIIINMKRHVVGVRLYVVNRFSIDGVKALRPLSRNLR